MRVGMVGVVIGFLLAWGGSAWAEEMPTGVVPGIRLDHPLLEVGTSSEVHVLVEFSAPDFVRDRAVRPPFNLAMVIDRSGSMAERGKLEYAKRAAFVLVDALKSSDRLVLVQYDDAVQTLWDGRVGDGHELRALLRSMEPGGSTNLHGGLREGVQRCLRARGPEDVSRVFLLSDGLANVGETSSEAIADAASEGRRQGVRVTGMGLGAEYDEDLMQAVAEAGGGSYHFIEHPSQAPEIYERELRVLSSMTTRGYRLRFVPSALVSGTVVYGYPQERSGDAFSVVMDDFHAGERRTLLMKLDVADMPQGEQVLGRFEWEYTDMATGKSVQAVRPLSVRGSTDRQAVLKGADQDVVNEAALARAELQHREALRLFEIGQSKEAWARMKTVQEGLASRHAAAPSVALQKKMEALDVEMEEQRRSGHDSVRRSLYLKKSKENVYHSIQGNRQGTMLARGDSGPRVKAVQQALQRTGHYAGALDGTYGPELETAVRAYQGVEGLDVDGVAGPRVLQKLGLY